MKNERTAAWAEDLRTTTAPQVRGHLAAPYVGVEGGEEVIGYCCLGRGCEVAGIERVKDLDVNNSRIFSYLGAKALPPREFARWLGFPKEEVGRHVGEVSLLIDFPHTLRTQCSEHEICDGEQSSSCFSEEYMSDDDASSCAQLNDQLYLTFAQIGDLVRYFGVTL